MTASVLNMSSPDSYHPLSYTNERQFVLNGPKSLKPIHQNPKLNAFNSAEYKVGLVASKERNLRKARTKVTAALPRYSSPPIQKLNFQTVTLLTREGAISSKAKQIQTKHDEFYSQTQSIPVKQDTKKTSFSPETVSVSASDRLQKALLNLKSPITKQKSEKLRTTKLDERAKSDTEAETNNEDSFEKLNIKTISNFSTPKSVKSSTVPENTKRQSNRNYSHSTGEILKTDQNQMNFFDKFSKSPKSVRFAEELEQNILNKFSNTKLTEKAENSQKSVSDKKMSPKQVSSEKFAFSKSQVSPDPKNIPLPNFIIFSKHKNSTENEISNKNIVPKTLLNKLETKENSKTEQKDKKEIKENKMNAFLNALKKLENMKN